MLATLFGFKGRLSRAGFIEVLLSVILVDVAALLSAKYVQEFGLPQVAAPGGAVALAVARFTPLAVALFTAWTVLAAVAKRAHDRNRTGWLILLAVVPVVGWAWLLIDLFVLPGTKGRNTFGRAPFGSASEARAEHVALAAMAAHAHDAAEAAHAPAGDQGHEPHVQHDAHGHDVHGHDAHGHDDHAHAAHEAHGSAHDAADGHHADSHAHDDHHAAAHDDHGHDDHSHDAHAHDAHAHDAHGHEAHDDDHHGHHAPADHHHPEPVHA